MSENRPIIGIDLGTTYSLVGAVQAGRPVLFPNSVGELLTPSAVSVDEDGQVLVGAAARARAVTHPERTAVAFKRDMGTGRVFKLGAKKSRPEELSAAVLAALKKDAEEALGHSIEEAVITVPAYFGDLQRQATRDAGSIAGLRVERIVNEPTAAALAYGLHELDRELSAVVLDVGGGTFDVTVLEIVEGVIEVQGSAGDSRLGGEDFADALVPLVAAKIEQACGAKPGTAEAMQARLREACEQAKRRLSDEPQTQVVLPRFALENGREQDVTVELTRAECDEAWRPWLDRIRLPIARALHDAKVEAKNIDEVLLVGGATRMPTIVELAARLFGRMPHRDLPPDEAVAHGAAIQAALKRGDASVDELVVTDVAPFTLGTQTGTKMGRRTVTGLFTPLIERGTVIPVSRVETFYPLEENQKELTIEVFQGEHVMCRDNTFLGQYTVKLPRGRKSDKGVDVRFSYDLNGILEVEMTVLETGKVHHLVIEQRPGALTSKQVESARKAMAKLKFHPRDTLPNRTALARADALFAELTGDARAALQEAVAAFQVAIENQDAAEIEETRERLVAFVDALRRSNGPGS